MSNNQPHDHDNQDVVESIVPYMPYVLPIGGGVLALTPDLPCTFDFRCNARALAALVGLLRAGGTVGAPVERVMLVGFSAGGHLAVWALSRPRLPKASPMAGQEVVSPRAAIALAGIIDLEAYHADGPDACGGPGTIDSLVGASGAGGRDVVEPGGWLLAYWMGRYHGFIAAPTTTRPELLEVRPGEVPAGGARPYAGPPRPPVE